MIFPSQKNEGCDGVAGNFRAESGFRSFAGFLPEYFWDRGEFRSVAGVKPGFLLADGSGSLKKKIVGRNDSGRFREVMPGFHIELVFVYQEKMLGRNDVRVCAGVMLEVFFL